MTSASIQCPKCHRKYKVAEKVLGRKVTCGNEACNAKFLAEVLAQLDSDEEISFVAVEEPSSGSVAEAIEPPPLPFIFRAVPATSMGTSPFESLDPETRLYRKRMLALATLAAVPSVLILVGLCVWLYFYAADFMHKREMENTFRIDAKAFIEKARKMVAAWPNSPEVFGKLYDELTDDFQRIPVIAGNQALVEQRNRFQEIGIVLIEPSTFIQSKPHTEAFILVNSKSNVPEIRDLAQKEAADLVEKSNRVHVAVQNASLLIDAAEQALSK